MWNIARQAAAYTMKLQSKMALILLYLLAAVLVLYSIGLVFTSNFNMGNLLVWLLTAAVVGYAVFRRPLNAWFATGAGRVVLVVLALCAAVYVGLAGFLAAAGYASRPAGEEQVMIVLGAGLRRDKPSRLLRQRLDAAYDYAVQHPDLLIVTSGGQGRDETVPEGQAMRDYLIQRGIDPARILAETASTSTEENFAFSLELLRSRGVDGQTPIVYVSNAFHCYRAGCYAKMAGFSRVSALPAHTPPRSLLPCYMREVLAVLYYWVFKTAEHGPMHAMVGLLSLNKRFFYK